MMVLTQNIKQQFFKTLIGDLPIEEFEQWVYHSKELEQQLSTDEHLELISYNFKQAGAKHTLNNLFRNYIDFGEYETWRLTRLLEQVENKEGNYPFAITQFYDLYCKGYYFLDNLAFGYGLTLECPVSKYAVDSFDQLKEKEQRELADGFYPAISVELDRVRNWITSRKVVPTGELDNLGNYNYIDNRTESEKVPVTYKSERYDSEQRKWWQVWKYI